MIKCKPKDGTHLINGIYYKIGKRRQVYQWAGGKWVMSMKTVDDLPKCNRV